MAVSGDSRMHSNMLAGGGGCGLLGVCLPLDHSRGSAPSHVWGGIPWVSAPSHSQSTYNNTKALPRPLPP